MMRYKPRQYKELSSNEEFLTGVRVKIQRLEVREREELWIKEKKRALFCDRIKQYGLLALGNILLLIFFTEQLFNQPVIFFWCLFNLLTVSLYENVLDTGSDHHGH